MPLIGREHLEAAMQESNRVSKTDFVMCLHEAGIDAGEMAVEGLRIAQEHAAAGLSHEQSVMAAFMAGVELGVRSARIVDGDRVERCAACGMDRAYHGADMHEFVPRVG